MIKAENLFIGAWVSVGGKPVEVRMISRRKIGYHRDGDKTRMVYARLADVEPLRVEKVKFGEEEWVVNEWIRIKVNDRIRLSVMEDGSWEVSNIFGEWLLMTDLSSVSELQRILKFLSRL